MSKKTVNRVAFESLIKACVEAGLGDRMEQMKSGFVKVEGCAGRRLYIPVQGTVGRVDVAGWKPEHLEELPKEDRPSGSVLAQLDFSKSPDEILADFQLCLMDLDGEATVQARAKGQKPSLAGVLSSLK